MFGIYPLLKEMNDLWKLYCGYTPDEYKCKGKYIEKPKQCGNLLQNPSFEAGLAGWIANNVQLNGFLVLEGTQSAIMQEAPASIYQDVRLPETSKGPLFLSFLLLADYGDVVNPSGGDLAAEVIWLDEEGSPLGTGLRLFIPGSMLALTRNVLTYVDVTNEPPANARSARLLFSKSELMPGPATLVIDNVILASLQDINLVTNSGFQELLFGWNSVNAGGDGFLPYEGTNYAEIGLGGIGSISQDIPITNQPPNSSFLLSFAVNNINAVPLTVTLEYRNNDGPLGIGLNLLVPPFDESQETWKTYITATQTPAPAGATIARVSFSGAVPNATIQVDKVILTRVDTPNLIINPSFENGLNNWVSQNVVSSNVGQIYEGAFNARMVGPAFIFQDVNIQDAKGCCYLLTFEASGQVDSHMMVQVIWLNAEGREIGLGASMIIPATALTRLNQQGQLVSMLTMFAVVTEPSPKDAAAARILFSVPNVSAPEIDLVSFTRLNRCHRPCCLE